MLAQAETYYNDYVEEYDWVRTLFFDGPAAILLLVLLITVVLLAMGFASKRCSCGFTCMGVSGVCLMFLFWLVFLIYFPVSFIVSYPCGVRGGGGGGGVVVLAGCGDDFFCPLTRFMISFRGIHRVVPSPPFALNAFRAVLDRR